MATVVWEGKAKATAQVDTFTPANPEEADIFVITINGKSIYFTAGSDPTVESVVEGIVPLLNASTEPEFAEITWSEDGTKVIATADTPGKPFEATASTINGGANPTETFAYQTTTECEGPNHWDTAENWSTGSVPVTGDDVIIENTAVPIKYGLDQLSGTSPVVLSSLTIKANVQGGFYLGLPETNSDGSPYDEYRDTYLQIGATTINIGEGDGEGCGRIKIDTNSNQTTLNVYRTGSALDTSAQPLLWKGTHADNTINVNRGHVGIAIYGGESANFQTMNVGYITARSGDANVYIGSGVTHKAGGKITQTGGTITCLSNIVELDQDEESVFYLMRSATATTVTIFGTLYDQSSGTITTLVVGDTGVFDKRGDARSQTITSTPVYKGAKVYDPMKTVSWTNGIDLQRCSIEDVTLEIGRHFTLSMSSI